MLIQNVRNATDIMLMLSIFCFAYKIISCIDLAICTNAQSFQFNQTLPTLICP